MKLIIPSLLTSHLPLTHTQIFRDKPPWWDMAAMTWDLCMKHEQVSNVIGSFGLMEVNMLGDDEFDGDDEEDEWCTVQNAPFDVEGLLNKDLKGDDDVAGWFKAYPFHVDYQRALECDKKSDKTFLKPFVAPFVGQCICLRIMIPNGGRGYLYGEITEVGDLPSEEDLSDSGSKLFGNGCSCPQPNCRLKDAKTRDQLLEGLGTLHGHKILALCSLEFGGDEFQAREKLRYSPLVSFFRGEGMKYRVAMQFNESGFSWDVVRISLVE